MMLFGVLCWTTPCMPSGSPLDPMWVGDPYRLLLMYPLRPHPNLLGIRPQSPRKDPAVSDKGFEAFPLPSHIKHFYRPQLRADCERRAS